jgi:hypothetical protein
VLNKKNYPGSPSSESSVDSAGAGTITTCLSLALINAV